MKPRIFVSGLVLACSGLLAACGGNGGNQPPVVNIATAPTPTPTPVPAFAQSRTAPMAAGTPVPFPSPNGFSGAVTVQAPGSSIPSGTTLTVTLQNSTPAGVTALPNTLTYIGLKQSNAGNLPVSIGAGAQVQTQIPLYFIPPSTPLAIDCYSTAWNLCVGPVNLPANNATTQTQFTIPFAFTMNANQTYWYALTIGSPSSVVVP